MTPFVALPSRSPAGVFGVALSSMPAVPAWDHVQTPAAGRGSGRPVPATDNYIVDDTFRAVISDVPTGADTDANAAALAKQGAPPRGEPR